ncbi:hypothetical protein [Microbacterium rhizomatis]|uniref:Flagellar biosynthesis protein n=1 Tax=Microbacterium rhizomatis TaxID=1631477 RepID=A0A5J5IYT8_9MICO|nr:hypothetical protein [Microbacterium rhizomatis]KAA9105067.1 hypothetical protein F6B43_18655 [Microbacterium rhizomatis]
MSLEILREDALVSNADGMALRLSLPWIRSLPLASLVDLEVAIDGAPVTAPSISLGTRSLPPTDLAGEDAWWFIQDRVVVTARGTTGEGAHEVAVSFRLVVPYLQTGPDGPLVLPFHAERSLVVDAPASAPTVSRDVV